MINKVLQFSLVYTRAWSTRCCTASLCNLPDKYFGDDHMATIHTVRQPIDDDGDDDNDDDDDDDDCDDDDATG